MSIEREPMGRGRRGERPHTRPRRPETMGEKIARLTKMGEADIVAGVVLTDLKHLPDSRKRELVADAAKVSADKAIAQGKRYNYPDNDKWIKSRKDKVKTLKRSKKEGKGLIKQLQSMYSYARHAVKQEKKGRR